MIFCKQEDILVERFDEQILLFDMQKNLPYVLNGVAAYVLENTDGEMSQEAIAKMVFRKYDVSFHQALDDIKELYKELVQKRIVNQMK